ncbi:MAG: hypothetical protein Q9219_006110 [cf. Caloplaca sp. 3 TL-2023]
MVSSLAEAAKEIGVADGGTEEYKDLNPHMHRRYSKLRLFATSAEQRLLEAAVKNAKLLQGLCETDYASSALQQDQVYLADIDREIKECDKSINLLIGKRKKEHENHKRYSESTARRFMHRAVGKGAKFAEKARKEEREYVEAVTAEHQCRSRRDEWSRLRDEAQKQHNELEATVKTHRTAQAELDALYESIFAGPLGWICGAVERDALQRAEVANSKVNMLISQARRLTPDIPGLGNSDFHRGHAMGDIFFDNIFSDMAQHVRIKSSQAQAEQVARVLKDLVIRGQQKNSQLQQDVDAASSRLGIARRELQQIR